ncbi:hypothetical protein GXW83_30925 [Streptacidiphilus sp. PB12-B1b]|uniref:glycosyltransferase family 39 protein n=1 Tax=Streptacidiphilus sp. PB12-B1b TaxID=2705012 RepID=UPI0015FE326A|nr:glycosyltransferase family 39 protein [Streptacidiphilus sp. PB12-B1b]QMU79464.1 hypothetical protein GXW83_30925 [Streptacidiphilus sp. PB12-B1b]
MSVHTPALTAPEQAARPPGGRSRMRRTLLGPPNTPRWARPALWAVLALAAAVSCYRLGQNGDANSYYAAAVLSGTRSWSSMFFGSLDTGNYITVDKPPVALWLMEASCRIFGFGSWQMLLPIALCGVAAVGVLYSAVRRSFGHTAATVAAVVLALTPITVAIDRDNNPDPVLVLLTVAAAWLCLEAIRSGRTMPLVWSGVLVGFAFNTKMLAAYLVLPAFFAAYLYAARGGVRKRVRTLLLAGAALAVSSCWWMVVVDSIPAADRPFIGSSTKNTVWDLVTGYNGLARITGGSGGGAGRAGGGGGGGGGGANFGGAAGVGRLFNTILGGQISWLIPFAVIACAGALVLRGRRRRTDLQRASLVLWGGWLLTHYLTFSFADGTFHPYYTTMLAPAIAALTGAGGVALLRAFRSRSAAWAWVLPLAVAATALWAIVLLRRDSGSTGRLWPLVAVSATAAVALLLAARAGTGSGSGLGFGRGGARGRLRLMAVGAVAALVALLAGPVAYAADTVTAGSIQGVNPTGGPSTGTGMGGLGAPGGGAGGRGFPGAADGSRPSGTGGGFGGFAPPGQAGGAEQAESTAPQGATGRPGEAADQARTARGPGGTGGADGTTGAPGGGMGRGAGGVSSAMLRYLEAHQGSATWLVATSEAQSAAQIILQSGGRAAIGMGGFTGDDPAMSLAKLKGYIASGKLHYVLLDGSGTTGGPGGATGGGMGGGRANSAATSYVTSSCTAVTASAYGGSSTGTSQTLYYCA